MNETVKQCEHQEFGVRCIRAARCRQLGGAQLFLCGWHGKRKRYQPHRPIEEQKRKYPEYEISITTELYERLAAAAKAADTSITEMADRLVREALDRGTSTKAS
jgi:hypothetical protein